ncbi:alginate lyase-domain-containing protein [Cantharellus anzutake]|uniref:alginate lyase-domain-containing protein n=1 Tax=Cantharellus anzutake TaxID=1750568 RepID=UPI001904B0FB|nr:alginate lyase-domain-containing protein [Cantharellus anzutake]KAF8337414.1 alginate lyase-domain-containing protein [Cantharellus anzutake]
MPPSGNRHDYLSWAPYHWPDCNWCPSQSSIESREFFDVVISPPGLREQSILEHPASNDPSRYDLFSANDLPPWLPPTIDHSQDISLDVPVAKSPIGISPPNDESDSSPTPNIPILSDRPLIVGPTAVMATPSSPMQVSTGTATTTSNIATGTLRPAKNPVKTSTSSPNCTPSPTKSMPPSATWTTCPYITKDGQRNPDVNLPGDSSSMVSMSQAVLYNSLAAVLSKTPAKYSQTAVSLVNTWFIDPQTAMNPHAQYGQVVRGPGIQHGDFMGVLDLRALIQIINGILILKAANDSNWTPSMERDMQAWIANYDHWMVTSDIGRKAGEAANNHGTFWMSQIGGIKLYRNDPGGVREGMQYYFTHQFLDQIAASGEQPFEAVRTRPFHYRCFNLEGMMTNAKLAQQAGLDMWDARSRYGGTIQAATDFLMRVDPKDEDVKELLPHVATAWAVFGDPTGKYRSFLERADPTYQSQPWWLYDQPNAIKPARAPSPSPSSRLRWQKRNRTAKTDSQNIVKPAAFLDTDTIQLDDGVFVTWEDLQPYYVLDSPDNTSMAGSTSARRDSVEDRGMQLRRHIEKFARPKWKKSL